MAKKGLILLMIVALSLLFSSIASAEELVNLQEIREEPVNVLEYAEVGIKTSITVGAVMFAKLLKTMNPVGIYNMKLEHGLGGARINLVEEFIHPKLNLVGGVTLKNEEPSQVLFGLELKLKFKGDLGAALSKFCPGVYWCDGRWWFGASLDLRGTKPKI